MHLTSKGVLYPEVCLVSSIHLVPAIPVLISSTLSRDLRRDQIHSSKGVSMTDEQVSKRELLEKAAYIAPAILTLKVVPSFASNGSGVTERG